MQLIIMVLACFAAAVAAPWLTRVVRHRIGIALAAVPAAVAAALASQGPAVVGGVAPASSWTWLPALDVALALRLDGLALLFALLITVIGAFVSLYAGHYLKGHEHVGRFFLFLYLFMGSMLGLVLADDLIALFVFWELTSISSYFLIGFKTEDPESRRKALQALLITTLGGLALMAGLILAIVATGETTVSGLNALGPLADHAGGLYLPILLLVLAGAFTKSAQFPFHTWLPGAMVAPTPVSAYLHSATMVKAGVFLLARLHPSLAGTSVWVVVVTAVGAATLVVGTLLALRQRDLKLILAYTTVASLGLMTMLLGIGTDAAVTAALAFLLAHALYKGALFLVAGAVDHATGSRDIRTLGGLRRAMPITAAAAALAGLSFAGLPPLLGFVAKETVLEAVWQGPGGALALAFLAAVLVGGVLAAGLVAWVPFWGRHTPAPDEAHEASPALWAGPVVLAGAGLLLGILPSLAQNTLVGPAATAVLAATPHTYLTLWHGWTPVLAASVLIVAAGALLVPRRAAVARALDRIGAPLDRVGPQRAYDLGVAGLLHGAKAQSRFWQNGRLRVYLAIIAGTTATLAIFTLALRGGAPTALPILDVRIHELFIAALLVAAAFAVTRIRSRLGAVVALGIVGYSVAVFFIVFSAPDLAMTQFLFETLTVLIFAFVLWGMPRLEPRSRTPGRVRDAVLCTGLGVVVGILVYAATMHRLHDPVSLFYAAHSYTEAHGRNVVNVILVDFRALDTLGEIIVIAVAALGVVGLLRLRRGGEAE